MYISGDMNTFESRLHQLPTGLDNLNTFIVEGKNYMSSITSQASGKLDKEIHIQRVRFTNSGEQYVVPIDW